MPASTDYFTFSFFLEAVGYMTVCWALSSLISKLIKPLIEEAKSKDKRIEFAYFLISLAALFVSLFGIALAVYSVHSSNNLADRVEKLETKGK